MKDNSSKRDRCPRRIFACYVILAAVICLCALSLAALRSHYLVFGRPDAVTLNSPVLALKDSSSNLYVADSSRKRLMRVNKDGKADMIVGAWKGYFSEIYDLALCDGEIFILDTLRDDINRRIKSEAVWRYSDSGRPVEEIYRVDHEIPTFDRVIAGLAVDGGGRCAFITLDEDSFTLHTPNRDAAVYSFPDALKMLNNFDIDASGDILFTTKRGEIYRADALTRYCEKIFVPGDDAAGKRAIPFDISIGNDGSVYVTDLGNKEISVLEDGGLSAVYRDPQMIHYRVSAKNGLVAINANGVMLLDSDLPSIFSECKVTPLLLSIRILVWVMALVLLAGAATAAICFARYLIRKNDFVIKISATVISSALFVMAVFSLIVARDITNRVTREMLNRLTSVVELAAMQIPAESLARLDNADDYMREDYTAVSSLLESVLFKGGAENGELYCVLYKILDGTIVEVYESDNIHGIVSYPYDWPIKGSDELAILETGKPKTYVMPSWVEGGVLFSLSPIYGDNGEPLGLIEIGSDLSMFQRENRNLIINLLLNILSINVAVIIIAIEAIVFVEARRRVTRMPGGTLRVPVELVRGGVFLVFFVTNIATAFLPLYAREIILSDAGPHIFPTGFLMAAPISADVLMGAVASIFGDWFIRRIGIRWSARVAEVFFAAGLWLEFAFYNIYTLTAGYALTGFGSGLALFLANLRIAGESDDADKEKGFAGVTVATTVGINAGIICGAFLISWLPKRAVFGFAACAGFAFLVFSERYLSRMEAPPGERNAKRKLTDGVRFVFSPRVFSYFTALLLPVIASGYFLIYMYPIVGYDLGITETHIGYSFLLNSLVVILFSTSLTRFFSLKLGKPLSLVLWAFIYAGAFIMFALLQNVYALLAAIVLLGFADSFGHSVSASYFTELPESQSYGIGRAIGICNLVDNVAQTAGPFVFSYILFTGVRDGLLYLAAGIAFLSIIFWQQAWKKGVAS